MIMIITTMTTATCMARDAIIETDALTRKPRREGKVCGFDLLKTRSLIKTTEIPILSA